MMEFKKIRGDGPERISLDMLDPVFAPGAVKTAVAPVTMKPSGLACVGELWLGITATAKAATSGSIAFTSTGAAQTVRFPITMPSPGGYAYHVYLDIYAAGFLVLAYIGTEDVIVPSGSVGPITWE